MSVDEKTETLYSIMIEVYDRAYPLFILQWEKQRVDLGTGMVCWVYHLIKKASRSNPCLQT